MAHNKNSKINKISINADESLIEFFETISQKDSKSEFCKTKNAEFFMKYGIYVCFNEFIDSNLSNFELTLKILKKVADGKPFDNIIENISKNNKFERREK